MCNNIDSLPPPANSLHLLHTHVVHVQWKTLLICSIHLAVNQLNFSVAHPDGGVSVYGEYLDGSRFYKAFSPSTGNVDFHIGTNTFLLQFITMIISRISRYRQFAIFLSMIWEFINFLLFSGACRYDVTLVIENTSSLDDASWDRVLAFVRNLVSSIDAQTAFGHMSRLAVVTYNSDATVLPDIRLNTTNMYGRDVLLYFINKHIAKSTVSSNEGIYDAMVKVRQLMKSRINARLAGLTTDRQAVLLFKYSSTAQQYLDRVRRILRWFMDAAVFTVVVG